MTVRTTDRALKRAPRDLARAAGPRPLHTSTQVVILAAGMGTRLGRKLPKPLTALADGRTIQRRQLDALREVFGPDVDVTVVVGYRAKKVMRHSPDVRFVYNPDFASTNTSKSLLKGLTSTRAGGVLWLNGDVVFDPAVLEQALPYVRLDESFVCVDTSTVADEEVKYTLDETGHVRELSKTVVGGLGEAVGINYVASADKGVLVQHLALCGDQDYFERGIETAIEEDGLRVRPVDISEWTAVEVDFPTDLERANTLFWGAEALSPVVTDVLAAEVG